MQNIVEQITKIENLVQKKNKRLKYFLCLLIKLTKQSDVEYK